jgi:hypothetical protein
MIAEIFPPAPAIRAIPVYTTHPGNTGARAERQCGACAFNYFPDDLMPGNEFLSERRKVSFSDMQVSAANTAGQHTEDHIPFYKFGTWDVLDKKGGLRLHLG